MAVFIACQQHQRSLKETVASPAGHECCRAAAPLNQADLVILLYHDCRCNGQLLLNLCVAIFLTVRLIIVSG